MISSSLALAKGRHGSFSGTREMYLSGSFFGTMILCMHVPNSGNCTFSHTQVVMYYIDPHPFLYIWQCGYPQYSLVSMTNGFPEWV